MINIQEVEIFKSNINTLKELSKDDSDPSNPIYMTESKVLAVNFDDVKTKYVNSLGLTEEFATSFDALLSGKANNLVFIEFKNGDMKNQKRNVKDKIRDGLLIFCDIVGENITYSRKNVDFLLVYNGNKNPLPNQLTRERPQESISRTIIQKLIMSKANKEFILFGLEKFQKLYFREVHTYTELEFEKYLGKINYFF